MDTNEDIRIIHRIPLTKAGALPVRLREGSGIRIAVLDTETTGFEPGSNKIIELGLVIIEADSEGIIAVHEEHSWYEDPKAPISEEITRITGITDEMVSGKVIPDQDVKSILEKCDFIVAHNAGFDRKFFEARFEGMRDLRWACTIKGISWSELGFEGSKLEYLVYKTGYFYEGHRASTDCLALTWLLIQVPEAMKALCSSVNQETVIVRAFGAPFAVKDVLKGNGYSWNDGTAGANKHWFKEIPAEALVQEREFLSQTYKDGATIAVYDYVDASKRFK